MSNPNNIPPIPPYNIIMDAKGIDKYSFSKLSSIHQCPYEFDLYYNKKIQGEGNSFASVGSLTHEILEKYMSGQILQFEMKDLFLENFDNYIPNGVKMKVSEKFSKDLTSNYKDSCAEYLENFYGFDGYEVVGTEQEFNLLITIRDKTIILNGFIDLILKDDQGEYYVVDYKSKGAFKNKEEIKKYSRQLYIYSLYIKFKYGKWPKKMWFEQFRINHQEIVCWNEEAMNETLNWVYDTVMLIQNEQFYTPNKDYFYCNNLCSYRNICDMKE